MPGEGGLSVQLFGNLAAAINLASKRPVPVGQGECWLRGLAATFTEHEPNGVRRFERKPQLPTRWSDRLNRPLAAKANDFNSMLMMPMNPSLASPTFLQLPYRCKLSMFGWPATYPAC